MKPIVETDTNKQSPQQDFDSFYRQYFPMVCAAVYAVLGSVEDAKDVAQNVFLRLAARGFSPERTKNVKGYLYRTATNHALSYLKWRGRRQSTGDDVEEMPDQQTDLQDGPFRGMVMRAIDQLKPEAAKMLTLRYAFDYTDDEIAKSLGKSYVSVRMTLSRARRRVKELIEQEARGEQ